MKSFWAALLAFVVGSIVLSVFSVMVFVGIAATMNGIRTTVRPGSVLMLDLDVVTDSPPSSLMQDIDWLTFSKTPSASIFSVLSTIDAAASDPNIEGIYIRTDAMAMISAAHIEEIRSALNDFRASGKFVVAYSEIYTQTGYYLASVADRVYMHPEGVFDWRGLSMQQFFFKGLLDKLDVEPIVVRHGTYKAAVEPFLANTMSPANRKQSEMLVNSMWKVFVGAVATSRNLPPEQLQQWADELAIRSPQIAENKGLIDKAIYEDQVEEILQSLVNPSVADSVTLSPDSLVRQDEVVSTALSSRKLHLVSFRDYAAQVMPDAKNIYPNQVAIIYAEGEIIDGQSIPGYVGGASLAQKLDRARRNDKIKAVVLRVNSPGGSALAADVIWREVERLRAVKPVVVSMGPTAASGGYYIACPADAILAQELTVTGSIGVFGLWFDLSDMLKNKLGVTVESVGSNPYSDMGSPFRNPAGEELRYFQQQVERTYGTFVQHVADGRNLSLEQVEQVAEGRVWSGVDAQQVGLVDGFGGLREAASLAADRAGLNGDFQLIQILDQPESLFTLVNSLFASERGSGVISKNFELQEDAWNRLIRTLSEEGVKARLPFLYEVR